MEEATMSHTVRRSGPRPPEKLTATLQILGYEFRFQFYIRPLRLGPYGVLQYYWMDVSQFRALKSEASVASFRNCIGHWAASMRVRGLGGDLVQQINYVLAVCYALVGQNKSLQKIYCDAYLVRAGLILHMETCQLQIASVFGRLSSRATGLSLRRNSTRSSTGFSH
jgi:hypothetical protein